jgi:hypothetical protein
MIVTPIVLVQYTEAERIFSGLLDALGFYDEHFFNLALSVYLLRVFSISIVFQKNHKQSFCLLL